MKSKRFQPFTRYHEDAYSDNYPSLTGLVNTGCSVCLFFYLIVLAPEFRPVIHTLATFSEPFMRLVTADSLRLMLVAIVAIYLLSGLLKGMAGIGMGLIAVPVVTIFFGPMTYLDLLATVVFAFVGARLLINSKRHFLVVALAAFVTAIGGGTVRDILLATGEIFWLVDARYFLMIVLGIALAYLSQRWTEPMSELLTALDSFSTTVFVLIGIQAAVAAHCPIVVVVLMGVLTGIGGGLIRDCVLTEKRLNLRDNRLVVNTFVTASAATLFSMTGVGEMTTLLVIASIQLGHAVITEVFTFPFSKADYLKI